MDRFDVGLGCFVILMVLSVGYSIASFRNLNPDVVDAHWQYLTRGVFVKREVFTEKGWQYHMRARHYHLLAAGTILLTFLLA